jgi:nucleotide-binding universal stress UspA family protein
MVSKDLIMQALHVLSAFRNPLIVLLSVIEVPSRTGTLDPEPYRSEIKQAEVRLSEVSKWLANQGMKVRSKVAVARNVVEGIVSETEMDDYLVVFLMKRRAKKGWKRLFSRSVSERVVRAAECLVMTAPLEQLTRQIERTSKH